MSHYFPRTRNMSHMFYTDPLKTAEILNPSRKYESYFSSIETHESYFSEKKNVSHYFAKAENMSHLFQKTKNMSHMFS